MSWCWCLSVFVQSVKLKWYCFFKFVVGDDGCWYYDDLKDDDLLMMMNSYMQSDDDVNDEIDDEIHVWKMRTLLMTICLVNICIIGSYVHAFISVESDIYIHIDND